MSPSLRLSLFFTAFLSATTLHASILFTTASDFTGWATGTGASATSSTSFDSDGISTNGLANASPGTTSTPGSIQIDPPISSLGDSAYSPNLASNIPFMSAIDPGFSPGFTADYTGNLLITYTVPTSVSPSDFIFGLNLAYDGDGYYENISPTLTSDPVLIDGLVTRTALFDYTIHPHTLGAFQFRVVYNSSSPITSPFFIDAIQVPEPTSIAACGFGFPLLSRRHRTRK